MELKGRHATDAPAHPESAPRARPQPGRGERKGVDAPAASCRRDSRQPNEPITVRSLMREEPGVVSVRVSHAPRTEL
jgi:hypothetical protein